MSLWTRGCQLAARCQPITIAKRAAHKKASIQVELQEYVQGVGVAGDIVAVRPGLMRNVLYPAGKASYIKTYQGPRNRQKEEQDKLSAAQQDKASSVKAARRREHATNLSSTLSSVSILDFKRAVVPDSINTFGSVTADDLAGKLKDEFGITVDKNSVEFKDGRIKSLGEHQVVIAGHPVKVVVSAA
ncbi:hypothetical protein LRAMOSA09582 [Lichtheimia ramosa]|uniref:50S ribosomal protein L9, chloroplastic n=1 Tax=Lichtheimia ramosa TaxID=688394 RepID=A0A077WIT6_9FUNG|nr:hypothetical protein LRAMOSA09582 [Lichtheimia ramosa]